jgi:antitoxin FitA
MPDILVRGLDAKTVTQLKARAKQHGRSLQREVKMLVERAAGTGGEHVADMLERWRKRLAGRKLSGSVRMIREDRKR